ncbi:MAG: hypothetical protein KJ574_03100 [Nanoarchaeota archaeon]|nr:hypothetical protein [Nanoarchaeota archaeon]
MQGQIEKNNLVTCEICSNKVPIREMKFDLSGTELICSVCYEKQRSRTSGSFEKKDFGPSLAIERRIERASRAESYVFYKCDTCKYSFSRKESFGFKKCPNCGKETLTTLQKNTAQKILDTSDNDKDPDLGIEFL